MLQRSAEGLDKAGPGEVGRAPFCVGEPDGLEDLDAAWELSPLA